MKIQQVYHTEHLLTGLLACPVLHWNALLNSLEFEVGPIIRYSPGECGSFKIA